MNRFDNLLDASTGANRPTAAPILNGEPAASQPVLFVIDDDAGIVQALRTI